MDAAVGAGADAEGGAAVATAEQLESALFGPAPAVFARIAAEPGPDGAESVVGMAIYFRTFSTWKGTHGIWLEDLYVRPEARGSGLGRAVEVYRQTCRGATLGEGLAVRGEEAAAAESEVRAWLQRIGLS